MTINFSKQSVFILSTLITFSVSLPFSEVQAKTKPAHDANQLLIVDCMLPGKIRQLGGGTRYQTARRPIKTSGADCEIRGGEYVAYDRANYATALTVWLPQAKAGDAKAQTYVGEMFEQGLGTTPDYDAALQWYMKAAEQGYDRAQMNLGAMYEKGLGVEKDEVAALNWYRKATGLGDDDLTFASNLDALEAENVGLQETIAQKDAKISELNKNLSDSRSKVNTQMAAIDSSQRELQQLRYEADSSGNSSDNSAETAKLKQQVEEKESQLAAQQREVQAMRDMLDKQQIEFAHQMGSKQGAQASFQALLEQQKTTIASLESQVSGLSSELNKRQTDLQSESAQMEALRAELQAAQNNQDDAAKISQLSDIILKQQTDLEQRAHNISYLEKEIANQNGQIASSKKDFENREKQWRDSADLALVQQQSIHEQLQASESKLKQAQAALDESNKRIAQQQDELQQQQSQITAIESTADQKAVAKTNELENQLGKKSIQLASAQGENAALKVEIDAINTELDRLRNMQTGLASAPQVAMRGTAPSLISEPNPDIPNVKFGNYYALIIGNNDYQNLPDLKTPQADAEALAEILKKHYKFKTEVLINADRYTILQALNKYRENLKNDDNFLLYYAGHGELDSVNNRGHWLPVDAMPDDQTNWISNVQITDLINTMNARHIMVIADSCYSGTLTRELKIPQLTSMSMATRSVGNSPAKKPDRYYELFTGKKSRTAMTSGGTKPVLDGGGGGHSIFANHLLNALQNNNGVLEGWMLYDKVNQGVHVSAASLKVDQEPEYAVIKNSGDAGAPFFFVST